MGRRPARCYRYCKNKPYVFSFFFSFVKTILSFSILLSLTNPLLDIIILPLNLYTSTQIPHEYICVFYIYHKTLEISLFLSLFFRNSHHFSHYYQSLLLMYTYN